MGFMGYIRPDGSVGVRNHVVVMSSVSCANGVVNAIARELPGIKAITHTEGCGRGLADLGISTRTLIGLAKNSNVAAVLLIGLGCEYIKAPNLAAAVAATGKPVEYLIIQERGGSKKTTQAGIETARKFLNQVSTQKRQEVSWDKLIIGLECGGSDAMSGVTANPLVGATADWLVSQGATAVLSETTEMIGTAHVLARRACTPEIARKIKTLIDNQHKLAHQLLGPFANQAISPGNMDGGLSSIQEKSLGCIIKGGTTQINEVIEYGATPTKKGLVIMDGPGSDVFNITGMAASGVQIIIFTTGRGTPVGFPIAPVIKVATNSLLFESMNDDMDINAGRIIEGMSIAELSKELNEYVTRVANGEMSKAESNLQDVLSIYTVGPSF